MKIISQGIECEARLLNINYGHNRELMEKCNRLREYAIFVAMVRKYAEDKKYNLTEAITFAIKQCLKDGILEDILLTQRNEVMSMILSTFDKELYEKDLKEEAFGEGAYQKLKSMVEKKLQKGLSAMEIADILEENLDVIEKIITEINEEC